MGIWQGKDNKKPSGGLRRPAFKVRKKAKLGSVPKLARLSDKTKVVEERVRGGNVKRRAVAVSYAVVSDKKTGTSRKERILKVLETPAYSEFARRNIITKGTVILVESGRAVVTSRPSQDGIVNAVLID